MFATIGVRYSFGCVLVKLPSVVLPVRLLPDIDTIEPPLGKSPVAFWVIVLLPMRIVLPALLCAPVVENEVVPVI